MAELVHVMEKLPPGEPLRKGAWRRDGDHAMMVCPNCGCAVRARKVQAGRDAVMSVRCRLGTCQTTFRAKLLRWAE